MRVPAGWSPGLDAGVPFRDRAAPAEAGGWIAATRWLDAPTTASAEASPSRRNELRQPPDAYLHASAAPPGGQRRSFGRSYRQGLPRRGSRLLTRCRPEQGTWVDSRPRQTYRPPQ